MPPPATDPQLQQHSRHGMLFVDTDTNGRQGRPSWGAMSNQILALRDHLLAEQVTCVVIEATSDFWKPFYYLLEDELDVMLAAHPDSRSPVRCLKLRADPY
jgi:hypothetical protein